MPEELITAVRHVPKWLPEDHPDKVHIIHTHSEASMKKILRAVANEGSRCKMNAWVQLYEGEPIPSASKLGTELFLADGRPRSVVNGGPSGAEDNDR